jgi:hypothetical protein
MRPSSRRPDRMVELVQKMLDLHQQLPNVAGAAQKSTLQTMIARIDRDIDQLVYELYDLTPDEIQIVEGD